MGVGIFGALHLFVMASHPMSHSGRVPLFALIGLCAPGSP